jgi:hypothetical protein
MNFLRIASALVASTLLLAGRDATLASQNSISLTPIGTYASGIFAEGGAEIVAHDPRTQRLFVVNAQAATVDVLSIRNPSQPEKVGEIDVTPFGAVANSVAVHEGVIAVAVESAEKTDPGRVVFFNRQLRLLKSVQVGALPDMLTFSPDGRWLLVANEGEPNEEYTVDPEGSVSIIDLRRGAAGVRQSDVRFASFQGSNSSDTAENTNELDPSIRIFGPGATVAQDIEPEYIAVSHDSRTAWVTCQENNALAVIDIRSAKVVELVGLGFKDHSIVKAKPAEIYTFDPATMPSIGTTAAGQTLFLGGFSGLWFEGIDPGTGRYKFITHTDRGPNAEPTGIDRPFLLPNFTPEIVRFELDRKSGALRVTERIQLKRDDQEENEDGDGDADDDGDEAKLLTGLPNTAISDNPNTPFNDERAVDLLGNEQPLDEFGGDFEGMAVDADGSFWMVDEYRPAIYHFGENGVLIERFVPIGTAAAAGKSAGTFGTEALPAVLGQRRQNRGFEAIAYDGGKIYAFMQSPLRNPDSLSNTDLNAMKNIRVVEFDPVTLATKQFIYVLDNPAPSDNPDDTRADKIGDAVSFGNGEFLVLERDDDSLPEDNAAVIEKKIYRFNLIGATDVSTYIDTVGTTGKTVDQLTVPEMVANGIQPIAKVLHVDLNEAGYNQVQKVEGLTLINAQTLAVLNDNDFGVASIIVNPDGTFTLNYQPEPIQLGVIETTSNGLDASDRDAKINIREWPVKGMYLPDGIAAYKVGWKTFLITANEGDAREYEGFEEAARIGDDDRVIFDPEVFPNGAVLKNNANLGRLNITTTMGQNAAGLYTELFTFGTRSFSIWDAAGKLVYDSEDLLERITAEARPAHFNASNDNNTFDNRSDDKGPEPEGVVIGKVLGKPYAFIGLERIGGVAVFDVSDPATPEFVDYVNNRNFDVEPAIDEEQGNPAAGDLGPEGLLFISNEASPNGRALLVVGNEISGTTTIYQIRSARSGRDH